MPPKISIVTPSFRSLGTIEQTMKSVLGQDYPNLEYVVVDGAGDETAQLLEAYSEKLHWWCSEPDGGQYDAIRKGFDQCTGDILFWLNADDKLLPGALHVVAEIFEAFPDIKWLTSLAPGNWDAQGYLMDLKSIVGFSKEAFLDGYFLPGTARRGVFIQQESTFFRRSLWESCADPFGGMELAGDFALWCNFYRQSDLYGVAYPLGGFRSLAGQRSEDKTRYLEEARIALEALRQDEAWAPKPLLTWARYLDLSGIPNVKAKVAKRIGYNGRQFVRRRLRFPDAYWAVKKYK